MMTLAFVMLLPGGMAQANVPADLDVKKTAVSTPIATGEAADFRISVQNIGGGVATNVIVNDLLPAGFNWFQGAPVRPECTFLTTTDGRQRLKCTVASIDPDGNFNVRVKAFTEGFCGDITNTANARSSKEPAVLQGNNTSTATITVLCNGLSH
jgi:uncharacterized repeat protein (TIGR01451 family)